MKVLGFIMILGISVIVMSCNDRKEGLDLLTAIDKEKIDVVRQLLDSGTNPNKRHVPKGIPLEGAYPLHLAIVKGNKAIVEILLERGAQLDLEAKNKDEATPLHWAAFFGQTDLVSLLIQSGAPINVLDANKNTPLDAAVYVWKVSKDDEEKANHMKGIIDILKSNGGEPADDL